MTKLTAAAFTIAVVLGTTTARAQTAPTGTASPTEPTSGTGDASTRPSTTTFFGDTGLWYVPTADVLAHGAWSVSAYRRGTNYAQGYTNVADFAGTFAAGIEGFPHRRGRELERAAARAKRGVHDAGRRPRGLA
jgi:hypothetical protein